MTETETVEQTKQDVKVGRHVVCATCYDGGYLLRMCGTPAKGVGGTLKSSDSVDCVVCADMCWRPCPRCGS